MMLADEIQCKGGKMSPLYRELVELVVRFRRFEGVAEGWPRFREIVETDLSKFLFKEVRERWLISIADTYADLGSPIEKRNALLITTFFNVMKFTESHRLYYFGTEQRVPDLVPGEVDETIYPMSIPLGYDPPHTVDTMRNMVRRIRIALSDTPHLLAIFEHLRERCVAMRGNPLHRAYNYDSRPFSS
ncbi:MAG: hypothetical protein ACKO2G_07580 [Verrucomicrobiales bacterium]